MPEDENTITVTGSVMPVVPGTLPAPPLECGLQLVEDEEGQHEPSSIGAFPEDSKFYYPRSL